MHQGDIYALLSGFFWSFSVILMRVAGFSIGPIPLTFFKNVVAIVCLIGVLLIMGSPLVPEISIKDCLRLTLSGVLGITIADTLFAAALNRLGASLQAIADCIYAPAIILVGFILFGEVLGPWEIAGGVLVLAGVFVGSGATPEVKNRKDLVFGLGMAAAAHITMAFGILMVRDLFDTVSLVWISAFRFTTATLVLAILVLPGRRRGTLLDGFRKPRDLEGYYPPCDPRSISGYAFLVRRIQIQSGRARGNLQSAVYCVYHHPRLYIFEGKDDPEKTNGSWPRHWRCSFGWAALTGQKALDSPLYEGECSSRGTSFGDRGNE